MGDLCEQLTHALAYELPEEGQGLLHVDPQTGSLSLKPKVGVSMNNTLTELKNDQEHLRQLAVAQLLYLDNFKYAASLMSPWVLLHAGGGWS